MAPDADPVTGDELREFCKGKIAHFKIPRNYKFMDEFSMTSPGRSRCGRFLLRRWG
ncbi:hypothetical protein [Marinobacter iranensis]|uniref:hypothetical protein n=1 Tax=Marinobacter iranensis TaxID=2962607 RepID=UPI003B848233